MDAVKAVDHPERYGYVMVVSIGIPNLIAAYLFYEGGKHYKTIQL